MLSKVHPTLLQIENFVDSNYDVLLGECGYESLYSNLKLGWAGERLGCGAAAGEFAIGADGRIYPCRLLLYPQFRSEDPLVHGLQEVWRSSIAFEKVRSFNPIKIEECSTCNLRRVCFGGCRGVAVASSGSIDGWVGIDSCHEQKCLIRRKLEIAVKAKGKELISTHGLSSSNHS